MKCNNADFLYKLSFRLPRIQFTIHEPLTPPKSQWQILQRPFNCSYISAQKAIVSIETQHRYVHACPLNFSVGDLVRKYIELSQLMICDWCTIEKISWQSFKDRSGFAIFNLKTVRITLTKFWLYEKFIFFQFIDFFKSIHHIWVL